MRLRNKNFRRGPLMVAVAAVVLAAGGGTAIAFGLWGNQPPPQPPAAIATDSPSTAHPITPSPTPTSRPTPTPTPTIGPILFASKPTHITIPAIGVDSTLMELGENPDGTVEVPPLGASQPAGWYHGSPTPGELGPAVILGHVDSYNGRSVFYSLGDMRPGNQISVTRSDGTVAVFIVERVAQYPKDDLPRLEVYGNTERAELRLITCGGVYNDATGHYVDNIVVYAKLVSSHPA